MFGGDCGLFPCFRRGRVCEGDAHDLNPVLLVSGMGGSILNARSKKSRFELRAWVRIFLANLEFKKYLWSVYNPKTGGVSSLSAFFRDWIPVSDIACRSLAENFRSQMLLV